MKKALLFAPMGSVHRRFNKANIDALISLGYEVHLLANFEVGDGTEKQNEEYSKKCMEEGIVIHSLPFQRHSLLKNIKEIKNIKKIIIENDFTIIHAHTETGGLLLRLCYHSINKDCRLIYTPHGMSFYKGSSLKSQIIYKPIEKWICKKMDANLSMNSEELEFVNKIKKESSFYVHGIGLDLSKFLGDDFDKDYCKKEFNLPQDSKIIVSIGELNENKNHKVVIEALSKMNLENIYYIICGTGELKDELLGLANNLNVNEHLILAGYRTDISQILHSCDLFVFPSKHEGLPVSLMEAMACVIPIVCSKIRGNVDLINNNQNGLLCGCENIDDYQTVIKDVLNELPKYQSLANENVQIIKNYSLTNVTEELIHIYSGVKNE